MPVHDWTRVDAGVFHDFHNAWITHLREALNTGLLSPDHYALGEQVTFGTGPDLLALRALRSEREPPRPRAVAVRHVSDHHIVALVEIVSPGNKASRHEIRSFRDKALAALARGIHLLLVDLQSPSPRDPQGATARSGRSGRAPHTSSRPTSR